MSYPMIGFFYYLYSGTTVLVCYLSFLKHEYSQTLYSNMYYVAALATFNLNHAELRLGDLLTLVKPIKFS